MQSNGKQFRVIDVSGVELYNDDVSTKKMGLFDYIEEYEPEPAPPSPPTELELLQEEVLQQSEYMVEMDYRLMNLELGL